MVRHINVQQLLIICGTMVWHSPVLKVLIHLFELTSCMGQHSMVYKIINKNVFMVKLSNFSWQTHVNMHIRVHFVNGCHIKGYTWVIHVQLITRCYASFVTNIFQLHLNMLCFDTLLIRIVWRDLTKCRKQNLANPDRERIRHLRQQLKGTSHHQHDWVPRLNKHWLTR